jgi:hypothetical protein
MLLVYFVVDIVDIVDDVFVFVDDTNVLFFGAIISFTT